MRVAVVLALVAACSVPPLKLDLAVSNAIDETCGASACGGVHLGCDSVVSIRIGDPAQPGAPYISQCQAVPFDAKHDLCSVGQINLDQNALPEQTLEVRVVLYPATDIPTDPITGDLICPTEREGLAFDAATGFPTGNIVMPDPRDPTKNLYPVPAIGGRSFWHPGDASVVVSLACNDLGALNGASCAGANTIPVTATINDFDGGDFVRPQVADTFTVRIGEPKLKSGGTDIDYVLNPIDTRLLDRTVEGPVPAWGANVDLMVKHAACLEVLEDGPQATATLTCKPATAVTAVDITGFRLITSSLSEILGALGHPLLDKGLVIGVVFDYRNLPALNQTVTATPPVAGQTATIEYLSGTGDGRSMVGGSATSVSGIFISRDAPFGTLFTTPNTQGAPMATVTGFGGLVEGKVTIVVLQLAKPPITQ